MQRGKMNIAFFVDTFVPQTNGVVTATINLAKSLADNGHKVLLICPKFKKQYSEFYYPGVKVVRTPSIPAFFYPEFRSSNIFNWKIYSLLKKEKIDILHFQVPMPLAFSAIIYSKLLKIPLVGTFHTFFGDPAYLKHAKLNYKFVEKFSWKFSNMYYNQCDLVTAPSKTTMKELVLNGVKVKRKVISNGIDPRIFDNSKSEKIKNKYNPKGELILFIGRMAHEKNIPYMLDCFKLALKKNPETKLIMIGDGPQIKEIKEHSEKIGIKENIIFLGNIPHNELVKTGIFGACKIFITASKTENQPMTMLEAQINGLVCIGINKRGIKDLIINKKNGFLIKEGDKKEFSEKIISLLNNKSLYEKLRKNTLIEVKKHLLDNIEKQWEKEYSSLIKNKR